MSFDIVLQHFHAGEPASTDTVPVRAALAKERYCGPNSFGFYVVEFKDGVDVEFNAGGVDGSEAFSVCAFHIRGMSPSLVQFVFEIAKAGDFVIFNCQGDGSKASPVLILVDPHQEAQLPADLIPQFPNRPVCTSGEMLGSLLLAGFDGWLGYRDQVVNG
jgi:hypothetical protein